MIFRVVVIFFMAVSAYSACSQTYLGLKLGMSNSWQSGDTQTNSLKRGVAYGITGMHVISDKVSLKTEILIAERGYRQRFNSNDLFDQLSRTYLDFPFMVGYSVLSPERRMKLDINAGGYYGRWLSGRYKSRIIEGTPILEEEYIFNSDSNQSGFEDNRNELGLTGGVSFTIPKQSNIFIFEIRYVHGLSSIQQFEESTNNRKIYSRSIVVSLAYAFDF